MIPSSNLVPCVVRLINSIREMTVFLVNGDRTNEEKTLNVMLPICYGSRVG
jgi:hypothetical protein